MIVIDLLFYELICLVNNFIDIIDFYLFGISNPIKFYLKLI